MPQLVKGGKNAYGWSKVNESGKIVIPSGAFIEYKFSIAKYVYLLSGSKKSGGFGLTTLDLLKSSRFSDLLHDHPEFENPESVFGESIQYRSRVFCILPIQAVPQADARRI